PPCPWSGRPRSKPTPSAPLPTTRLPPPESWEGPCRRCLEEGARMPVLATNAAFLEVVRKSNLLEPAALDAYLKARTEEDTLPDEPKQLAALLVRDGLLTKLQAQQVLQGRYKGFLINGKYKVLELLGAGGMGKVFLCEHVYMRRLVAIKTLRL